jgi:putative restriction endonuclease
VLNEQGKISGRAQSAVRPLSSDDFKRIVALGLEEKTPLLPRIGGVFLPTGFEEEQTPFEVEEQRERVSFTVSRIVRDRVFRGIVLRAYDQRCAVTGLKFINGWRSRRGRCCSHTAG